MAGIVNTQGNGRLVPAVATTTKRNFSTAIGGVVRGQWYGCFIQLPPSGMTNNATYPMLGYDGGGTGSFASTVDNVFRMSGDSTGRGDNQMRPSFAQGNAGGGSVAWQTAEGLVGSSVVTQGRTNWPQTTRGPASHFVAWGQINTNPGGSAVWVNFAVMCPVGSNAPVWYVSTTAPIASYITGVGGRRIGQVFVDNGSYPNPAGLSLEHVVIVDGNFPWDAANSRPDLSIVAGLAGAGGTNYTYTDAAVLNGGVIADWWKLSDEFGTTWTTGGLANSGTTAAAGALVPTGIDVTSGVLPGPRIGPPHWYTASLTLPTLTMLQKFRGGRGARATTVSGAYATGGSVTGIERRWEKPDGSVVAGFDWASVATFGSGAWGVSSMLPRGRYNLRLRTVDARATVYGIDDFLVGTKVVMHGQSGMFRAFNGTSTNTNYLSLALNAGVEAIWLDLGDKSGNGGSAYTQPTLYAVRASGGATPGNLGSGVVAFMNEWQAADGGPVMIVNMSLSGTNMGDWARNQVISSTDFPAGYWPFLGDMPPVLPGVSAPNGAGIAGTLALYAEREADAHGCMWTPGYEPDLGTTGGEGDVTYFAAMDARFNIGAPAPIVFFPPWRTGADWSNATFGTPLKRIQHTTAAITTFAGRGVLAPCWPDAAVENSTGGAHAAFLLTATATAPSDFDWIGAARLSAGMGRSMAWCFNHSIKARGPTMVKAYFTDGLRTSITVETGRKLRTLNGAAIHKAFFISEDNGATWPTTIPDYTLAISGTKVIISRASGSFPATTTRVEYNRWQPFPQGDLTALGLNESNVQAKFDGLLYDYENYRSRPGLADRAGNPLTGVQDGLGLLVTDKVAQLKLVSTAKQPGSRAAAIEVVDIASGNVVCSTTPTVVAG